MTDETPLTDDGTDDDPTRREELLARIDLLEEETRRLRNERDRTKRVQHRRTAAGLALLGAMSVVGGLVFPDAREVLFALGATGLFAGLLTIWVTPERFVSADVGERVYAALARNHARALTELGVNGEPTYVPRESDVRLYVPQRTVYTMPDERALDDIFVVGANDDERGVAFEPTGSRLVATLDDVRAGGGVAGTAAILGDALVETFELVDGIETDVDLADGRATFEAVGAVYGDPEAFDHPVVSTCAVGLATVLDLPVTVEVTDDDPLVVTCRWEADERGE